MRGFLCLSPWRLQGGAVDRSNELNPKKDLYCRRYGSFPSLTQAVHVFIGVLIGPDITP